MGPPEMLNLRWDGFEANARVAFREFREDGEFLDVTLVTGEGNQVQANKVILAGGSSFFHKIFRENPHPHPLIYLKGVNSKHVLSILDFLYTGEASIVQEDLNNFLDIAKDLKVKGLTDKYPDQSESSITGNSSDTPYDRVAAAEAGQSPKISLLHSIKSVTREGQSPKISHLHGFKSASQGHLVDYEAGQSPKISHLHGFKSASQGHLVEISHQDRVVAEEAGQSLKISHLLGVTSAPRGHLANEEIGQSPKISDVYSLKPAAQERVAAEETGKCLKPKIAHLQNAKPAAGQWLKISHLHSVTCSQPTNIFTQSSCGEDHDNSSATYDVKIEKDDQLSNASYEMNGLGDAHNRHDSMYDLYNNEENNDNMVPDGEQDLMEKEFSSGKQVFQCSVCNKTLSTAANLKKHKIIHTGEKPFGCSVCAKMFSRPDHLKLHEKIHTGEKPYQCFLCSKRFIQLSNFKRHKCSMKP